MLLARSARRYIWAMEVWLSILTWPVSVRTSSTVAVEFCKTRVASFPGLARSSLAVHNLGKFCTASDKHARPGNEDSPKACYLIQICAYWSLMLLRYWFSLVPQQNSLCCIVLLILPLQQSNSSHHFPRPASLPATLTFYIVVRVLSLLKCLWLTLPT